MYMLSDHQQLTLLTIDDTKRQVCGVSCYHDTSSIIQKADALSAILAQKRYCMPLLAIACALALALYGARPASGYGINVTIDDTYGDEMTGAKPVYAPDDGLPPIWENAPCGGCGVQVSPSQVHNRKWHAVTVNGTTPSVSITLNFNGM